jgi:hypothetical protein
MMLVWAGHAAPSDKKKPIGKSCRGKGRKNTTCANNTTVHKNQWKLEEARIDEELAHLPPDHPQPPSDSPSDNIDEEIQRLERELRTNQSANSAITSQIEERMAAEAVEMAEVMEGGASGQDAASVGWLIHILEEKQIAESVSKIVNCERSAGELKFMVQFEQAMHVQPQLLTEVELRRLNQLRETSLLKFYRTGAKSLHSFTCQNVPHLQFST